MKIIVFMAVARPKRIREAIRDAFTKVTGRDLRLPEEGHENGKLSYTTDIPLEPSAAEQFKAALARITRYQWFSPRFAPDTHVSDGKQPGTIIVSVSPRSSPPPLKISTMIVR